MVNVWTRDDLPSMTDALGPIAHNKVADGASIYRDAVVEHLNAHHPKSELDRWRRAHALVEQERDRAICEWHEH